MKKTQGFGLTGLLVLLALVIVAGGGYAYMQKLGPFAQPTSTQITPTPPPTTPTVQPTPTTGAPTASIDKSSLTSSSLTPTITGHASGVTSVNVKVTSYEGARVAQDNASYNPSTGAWSFPVDSSTETRDSSGYLSLDGPGTYSVYVNGLVGGNSVELAKGTLIVAGGSISDTPIASIDLNSLGASTGGKTATDVTLAGAATHVGLVDVYIVRADGYAYGQGTLGFDHGATVTNGRWSFTAKALPVGTYTVTIRLPDMPSGPLPAGATLITGVLVVSN